MNDEEYDCPVGGERTSSVSPSKSPVRGGATVLRGTGGGEGRGRGSGGGKENALGARVPMLPAPATMRPLGRSKRAAAQGAPEMGSGGEEAVTLDGRDEEGLKRKRGEDSGEDGRTTKRTRRQEEEGDRQSGGVSEAKKAATAKATETKKTKAAKKTERAAKLQEAQRRAREAKKRQIEDEEWAGRANGS